LGGQGIFGGDFACVIPPRQFFASLRSARKASIVRTHLNPSLCSTNSLVPSILVSLEGQEPPPRSPPLRGAAFPKKQVLRKWKLVCARRAKAKCKHRETLRSLAQILKEVQLSLRSKGKGKSTSLGGEKKNAVTAPPFLPLRSDGVWRESTSIQTRQKSKLGSFDVEISLHHFTPLEGHSPPCATRPARPPPARGRHIEEASSSI